MLVMGVAMVPAARARGVRDNVLVVAWLPNDAEPHCPHPPPDTTWQAEYSIPPHKHVRSGLHLPCLHIYNTSHDAIGLAGQPSCDELSPLTSIQPLIQRSYKISYLTSTFADLIIVLYPSSSPPGLGWGLSYRGEHKTTWNMPFQI